MCIRDRCGRFVQGSFQLAFSNPWQRVRYCETGTDEGCDARLSCGRGSEDRQRLYPCLLYTSYPARTTRFPARTIRLESSRLVVGFTEVGYTASVIVTITDAYIAFRLDTLSYHGYTSMRPKEKTPIDETVFVQLPVRDRTNFGDWLNVMWDDTAAIALIATDVHTQIEAEPRRDHHLFQAGTVRDVKLENAGACLLYTSRCV